jgi:hypothetical protein
LYKAASKSINLNPKRLATLAPSRQGTPRAAESRRDKRAARQAGLSIEDTIIVEVPKVRDVINSVTLTEDRLKERTLLKKQEGQYISDSQRPNVYTGLYYREMTEEYGLPGNLNVLIGEDKHRWFKLIVYITNHSNIEKTMLAKENLRQTVRLLLLNAFYHSDPELTESFANL